MQWLGQSPIWMRVCLGWLVALALMLPYVWTTAHQGDEFALANVAVRMSRGEVFAKDVFCLVMPGSFLLTAWVFKCVGPALWVARLFQAMLVASAAVIYWRLARALGVPRWLAPLVGLLGVSTVMSSYYFFGHRWFSQTGVAVSLACVWRATGRHRRRDWLLVGVAAGSTYVMQQLDGAALCIALGLGVLWLAWFLGWTGRDTWERLAVYGVGWAIPLGCLGVYLWWVGALGEAFYDTHLWALTRYRAPGNPNDVLYGSDLAYMLSTTGPWISRLHWYTGAAITLVGCLAPLLVGVAGAFWLVGVRREVGASRRIAFGGVLVFVAVMAFLAALRGRADTTHVLAVSLPHVLLAVVAISHWERQVSVDAVWRGLTYLPRLSLGALVVAGAVRTIEVARRYPDAWLSIRTPDERIRAHPTLQAVARRLAPGDMLLGGMHSAIYNFYLAPNPTRWSLDWTQPDQGFTTAAQFAEIQAAVRDRRPRLLVITTASRAEADAGLKGLLDDYACCETLPFPTELGRIFLQVFVYERRDGRL